MPGASVGHCLSQANFLNKNKQLSGGFVLFLLPLTTEAAAFLMKKSNWNLTFQSQGSCREQNYNENNTLQPEFHMC